MKNKFITPVACWMTALVAIPVMATRGQVYNAAQDFSASSNPNSVWSYGYSIALGGSFILHTASLNSAGLDFWRTDIGPSAISAFHNPTMSVIRPVSSVVVQPGELGFNPGFNNEYAILRFTAPFDSDYRITGSFAGMSTIGTSSEVHLLMDGGSALDGAVDGFGPGSGPSFDLTLRLNAGGFLDFAVGSGLRFANDQTALAVQIVPVPEPATALLTFSGGLLLFYLARSRTR